MFRPSPPPVPLYYGIGKSPNYEVNKDKKEDEDENDSFELIERRSSSFDDAKKRCIEEENKLKGNKQSTMNA